MNVEVHRTRHMLVWLTLAELAWQLAMAHVDQLV